MNSLYFYKLCPSFACHNSSDNAQKTCILLCRFSIASLYVPMLPNNAPGDERKRQNTSIKPIQLRRSNRVAIRYSGKQVWPRRRSSGFQQIMSDFKKESAPNGISKLIEDKRKKLNTLVDSVIKLRLAPQRVLPLAVSRRNVDFRHMLQKIKLTLIDLCWWDGRSCVSFLVLVDILGHLNVTFLSVRCISLNLPMAAHWSEYLPRGDILGNAAAQIQAAPSS